MPQGDLYHYLECTHCGFKEVSLVAVVTTDSRWHCDPTPGRVPIGSRERLAREHLAFVVQVNLLRVSRGLEPLPLPEE